MSVTIETSPQDYMPSDNPVVWTFSSDQTAQTNFAFIVEVYINGTLAKEELVFLENGIYAKYDAQLHTSNACGAPNLSQDWLSDALNTCTVSLDVYEYYGATPAKQANTATADVTCWKAGLENFDYIDWTATDYIATGTGKKWLTNFDGGYVGDKEFPKVARTGEQFRLMTINDEANLIGFEIEIFDSTGTTVNSVVIASLAISANKISTINLTPSVIIANTSLTQGDFDSGAYMIICSTELADYRVDFDDACIFDRAKRIHFLTQIGSVEALTFGLISNYKANVQSFGYQRVFGQWDEEEWTFSKERGINVDYVKLVSPKLEVESDWLEEIVQQWLVKNLYSSVLVLEELDGDLIQRKVDTASYEYKYNQNQMLFTERFEMTLPSHRTLVL